MTTASYDVAVIGAGAAGMMAAIRAAERGLHTVLLEKNRKVGVKILMSGGTRCNLTHNGTSTDIAEAYDRLAGKEAGRTKSRFLRSALSHLTPDALIALFEAEGVATKIEPTGKVFPASNKAIDVQQALLRMLKLSGAELACEEPVGIFTRSDNGFHLKTSRRELLAKRVVVSVGGRSYPGCGTIGEGYAWAKSFGHRIVPPRPALVPLSADMEGRANWIRELQGVTLPDVRISIRLPGKPIVTDRRGSFLFTHFGLSGPAAMDASRFVTESPSAGWIAECDFLPSFDEQMLREHLQAATETNGKRVIAAYMTEHLPRRFSEVLLEQARIPADRRLAELSKEERTNWIRAIQQTEIPLVGSLGFKKAEVTAGGVDLSEINPRTMESKRVEGLYFAGEVLDLDGPIGGYNFQAAFSTGAVAGDSVLA